MPYTVNEDGSVTKKTPIPPTPSGGSNDNSGCWVTLVVVAVIGFIIFAISNSNNSSSVSDYSSDTSDYTIEEDYQEPPYINVSSTSVSFDADGGSYFFSVNSNVSWYIDTNTESWGHLNKSDNELTLRVDANDNVEPRTDYFILKAGDKSIRVNISQEGKIISNSANILSVWMTHGEYQNGVKGMTIHTKFTTENLRNQMVYVKIKFYYDDNSTPLHDPYGNNLVKTESGVPSYDSAIFEDFKIFIPYDWLNMEPGEGTCTLSFDVSVHESSGEQLDISENTRFDYTSR